MAKFGSPGLSPEVAVPPCPHVVGKVLPNASTALVGDAERSSSSAAAFAGSPAASRYGSNFGFESFFRAVADTMLSIFPIPTNNAEGGWYNTYTINAPPL